MCTHACVCRPAIPIIIANFPDLWTKCEAHNLLRQALLELLSVMCKEIGVCACLHVVCSFVPCIGEKSVALHGFMLPLLQFCIKPDEIEREYLVPDALKLWLDVLQNCPSTLFAQSQSQAPLSPLSPTSTTTFSQSPSSPSQSQTQTQAQAQSTQTMSSARELVSMLTHWLFWAKSGAAHADVVLKVCIAFVLPISCVCTCRSCKATYCWVVHHFWLRTSKHWGPRSLNWLPNVKKTTAK